VETIYPGLIELYNHLSYNNALFLWGVPKNYTNRNQWSGLSTPEYHQLVTAPMSVLGKLPQYVNAICSVCGMPLSARRSYKNGGVELAKRPPLSQELQREVLDRLP
jgi:hypothetical protein